MEIGLSCTGRVHCTTALPRNQATCDKVVNVQDVAAHRSIKHLQMGAKDWMLTAGNDHADNWAQKVARQWRPAENHDLLMKLALVARAAASLGSKVWNSWLQDHRIYWNTSGIA